MGCTMSVAGIAMHFLAIFTVYNLVLQSSVLFVNLVSFYDEI